jgi:hypothetical protein
MATIFLENEVDNKVKKAVQKATSDQCSYLPERWDKNWASLAEEQEKKLLEESSDLPKQTRSRKGKGKGKLKQLPSKSKAKSKAIVSDSDQPSDDEQRDSDQPNEDDPLPRSKKNPRSQSKRLISDTSDTQNMESDRDNADKSDQDKEQAVQASSTSSKPMPKPKPKPQPLAHFQQSMDTDMLLNDSESLFISYLYNLILIIIFLKGFDTHLMDFDLSQIIDKGKGKRAASQSPLASKNPDKRIKDTAKRVDALSLTDPQPSTSVLPPLQQGLDSDSESD